MDNSVFTRRTYLRRALLGGGLAWLALFLLCFGIASIDYFGGRPEFWDTLSRTQLSTDEAYLAFGPARLSKKPPGFSGKRLAVCCAHNLPVRDGQIPHWQPERYFLSRTCRERK